MYIPFAELVIYLLPGFLGLWVFKRVTQEDIDKRGESTQIAIALLLGMSAFCLLALVSWALSQGPWLAKWISPKALTLEGSDQKSSLLNAGFEFWVSYGALCLLAMLSGGLWAYFSEKGWSPTRGVPKWFSARLKRGPKTLCESALRALIDEMREKGQPPSLVRVYTLGEDRDKALIGWWNGYSESEKEIRLTRLELCDADPEFNGRLKLQPRQCWVNHSSGLVIEFLEWDKTQDDKFDAYLRKKYDQIAFPKDTETSH